MINIKPRVLLAVYLSVFVAFAVVAVDILFLKLQLKSSMPSDPNEFLWFTIIFTLPHILASFFSFFDKEYIQEYRSKLLRGAQISIAAVILLPLISIELAFYVFAVFTMVHVLFQQSGVAKSLMRGANSFHGWWQWSGALIAGILYIDIYTDTSISNIIIIDSVSVLTAAFCLFAFFSARASRNRIGSMYFWMTHVTVLSAIFFAAIGYPILTIALPRVVHDLTAYIYYTSHDHNRFIQARSNVLYRLMKSLGIPVVVSSLILSMGAAALLQSQPVYSVTLPLISIIILMHYHTESYIWKRGSLHRKYINCLQ